MRFCKRLPLIFCFFIVLTSNAQNRRSIEIDLLRSFKKISYWDRKLRDTSINANDSLANANNEFGQKLKNYSEGYPSTITYPFTLLKKEYLNICSSTDGLFRIYSWYTGGDGTMHEFENVMQYKNGEKLRSIWVRDTAVGRQDKYVPYYTHIYTFKANYKTYYLGIYEGVYCSGCRGQGLQVFAIENRKLNEDVKLIKTQTGMHSRLYFEYDLYYAIHRNPGALMHFDAITKTIYVPVIVEKEKITNRYIAYKFTGKYFEKVKN